MFGYTLKPNNYRYLENFTIFFPPHLRRLKTYKIISFSIFFKIKNFVCWRNFANKCFWDFWTDFRISNLGGVWCQVTAGARRGKAMDMATIILSIVFVLLVRASWLAPPPTQHRGGASDLFGSSWNGFVFLFAVFFFLFKFSKKKFGEHFAQFSPF
jgi:hypothetical protein